MSRAATTQTKGTGLTPTERDSERGQLDRIDKKGTAKRGAKGITPVGGWSSRSGSIQQLRLDTLREAALNWRIYKDVNEADRGFAKLVKSMRENGQLNPILVSSDRVIVSGHRRFRAARVLRWKTIQGIVVPIQSDDRVFRKLLVESNTQRDKDAGEILREALVTRSPKKAGELLAKWRTELEQKDTQDEYPKYDVQRRKDRGSVSKKRMEFLNAVKAILRTNLSSLPMTIRQIHYQLLNAPPLRVMGKLASRYKNDKQSYHDLINLLTRARIAGEIDYASIHDPSRPIKLNQGSARAEDYVRSEVDCFLKGYQRDLLQSQPRQVVVICEKQGLQRLAQRVCSQFCVPLFIGRGYGSLTMRAELHDLFKRSGKDKLVMLFLGDFDPEGENIIQSTIDSLHQDFGLHPDQMQGSKVALTKEQTVGLPVLYQAKMSSSRYEAFVRNHGKHVWELDALPPDRLRETLRSAIEAAIDKKLYNAELRKERKDAAILSRTREQVLRSLDDGKMVS